MSALKAYWTHWRWIYWQCAVVLIATREFSEPWSKRPGWRRRAFRDAIEWVQVSEKALRWWFEYGVPPKEGFEAVTEEDRDD